MKLCTTIAQNLKQMREKNSFSQKRMAEKLDISLRLYNELENASANPTIETLEKISENLEIPLTSLLLPQNNILNIHSENHNGETKNGVFQSDETLSKMVDKLLEQNKELIELLKRNM